MQARDLNRILESICVESSPVQHTLTAHSTSRDVGEAAVILTSRGAPVGTGEERTGGELDKTKNRSARPVP